MLPRKRHSAPQRPLTHTAPFLLSPPCPPLQWPRVELWYTWGVAPIPVAEAASELCCLPACLPTPCVPASRCLRIRRLALTAATLFPPLQSA